MTCSIPQLQFPGHVSPKPRLASPCLPSRGRAQHGAMSDQQKTGYDPADQSPAEGQSRSIPAQDRGQNPGVDPADKDQPAEGGREEAEDGDRASS
ncbi:hypothetical protein [Deinococcus wulumuqiensis]|nr:hypothetical protein [Deinococcus wulumuqiensis]